MKKYVCQLNVQQHLIGGAGWLIEDLCCWCCGKKQLTNKDREGDSGLANKPSERASEQTSEKMKTRKLTSENKEMIEVG